jgi:hypothetical protein
VRITNILQSRAGRVGVLFATAIVLAVAVIFPPVGVVLVALAMLGGVKIASELAVAAAKTAPLIERGERLAERVAADRHRAEGAEARIQELAVARLDEQAEAISGVVDRLAYAEDQLSEGLRSLAKDAELRLEQLRGAAQAHNDRLSQRVAEHEAVHHVADADLLATVDVLQEVVRARVLARKLPDHGEHGKPEERLASALAGLKSRFGGS